MFLIFFQRYKVENLKLLHKVCFNRTGKVPVIKKNIRKFNGFDFDKDSTDYEKKRAMLSKYVYRFKQCARIYRIDSLQVPVSLLNLL